MKLGSPRSQGENAEPGEGGWIVPPRPWAAILPLRLVVISVPLQVFGALEENGTLNTAEQKGPLRRAPNWRIH
jgi:hypothetical protein